MIFLLDREQIVVCIDICHENIYCTVLAANCYFVVFLWLTNVSRDLSISLLIRLNVRYVILLRVNFPHSLLIIVYSLIRFRIWKGLDIENYLSIENAKAMSQPLLRFHRVKI